MIAEKAEQFGKNLPKMGMITGRIILRGKELLSLKKSHNLQKKKGGCEKLSWGDLYVSATDWDDFTCDNQAT